MHIVTCIPVTYKKLLDDQGPRVLVVILAGCARLCVRTHPLPTQFPPGLSPSQRPALKTLRSFLESAFVTEVPSFKRSRTKTTWSLFPTPGEGGSWLPSVTTDTGRDAGDPEVL